MSSFREIDTVIDEYCDGIEIGVIGDVVTLNFTEDSSSVVLDAGRRAEFMRGWAEAVRLAEANAAKRQNEVPGAEH